MICFDLLFFLKSKTAGKTAAENNFVSPKSQIFKISKCISLLGLIYKLLLLVKTISFLISGISSLISYFGGAFYLEIVSYTRLFTSSGSGFFLGLPLLFGFSSIMSSTSVKSSSSSSSSSKSSAALEPPAKRSPSLTF